MFRSAKASSRLSPRLARPSLAMFAKDKLPVRVEMNKNRNISLSEEHEFENSEHWAAFRGYSKRQLPASNTGRLPRFSLAKKEVHHSKIRNTIIIAQLTAFKHLN